jgi:hypothetical protein
MIMPAPSRVEDYPRVECACCGEENIARGGYCRQCYTPVELSRSVAARGAPARFVSVLGPSNAGKTVYLGVLLDILSRGRGELRGLPNGAFSVSMQQQTMTALARRRFPEKTPSEADSWRWVHCEIIRDKQGKEYLDLVTPDFAGEAVALEIEQPGTFPTIHSVVAKSAALLVLLDSVRVRDGDREEDFFGMKLAAYIAERHQLGGGPLRKKLQAPVAVVLTKADACPEAADAPAKFAAAHLPGLVQYCSRNFAHAQFFAAGVVGSSAVVRNEHGWEMPIPLHIEPRGVTDPLQWIVSCL